MPLRKIMLFILVALFFIGCTQEEPPPTSEPPPPPTEEPAVEPEPTEAVVEEPTEEPVEEPEPTAEPEPTEEPEPVGSWPDPAKAYGAFSREPVTEAEKATFAALVANYPPERIDAELAVAFKGLAEIPRDDVEPVTEPLNVGTRQEITVNNTDLNTNSSPNFTLEYVSDHAYFWFDSTEGLSEPDPDELEEMGTAFDIIYQEVIAIFGSENNPGIDGDPRVHIVNASPLTICDVDASNSHTCGLLGYFGSADILPKSVDEHSNEREMFVMNGGVFGSSIYLDVLAHEFRHMIESNYDANDWDWEVEGSAMLAEDLLDFPGDPLIRGNMFLSSPDQQLNRWTDGNPISYYGQGYVINRYIYNRLGPELHTVFATHPAPGFEALDAIAAEYGVDFESGEELFIDWLAALAIHSLDGAPEKYALRDGLDTVSTETVNSFPTTLEETVNQYAADYYQLFGDSDVTLNFTGSNHTPLLKVLPTSGEKMWLANRANYSNPQMTRTVDLTGVDSATLQYDVFHEIEQGYDFAYVSVSTDGGTTWQGLQGAMMQGEDFNDDPSDSALTDAFYTGRSREWVQETVSLDDYAGQEVLLRFEYVTDPILTFGGIAFDNIAIPEIDYYDDAESDTGWVGEGFVQATGYVPQKWNVQVVTFVDGAPVVTPIELSEDNTATAVINLDSSSGGRPILLVSAIAPMTLESATYQLDITE